MFFGSGSRHDHGVRLHQRRAFIPMQQLYPEHLEKSGVGIRYLVLAYIVRSILQTNGNTPYVPETCSQFYLWNIIYQCLGHGCRYFSRFFFRSAKFHIGINPIDAVGIHEHFVVAQIVINVQSEQKPTSHSNR